MISYRNTIHIIANIKIPIFGVPNFQNNLRSINNNYKRNIKIVPILHSTLYYILDNLYIDNQNLKELISVERRKTLTNLKKRKIK